MSIEKDMSAEFLAKPFDVSSWYPPHLPTYRENQPLSYHELANEILLDIPVAYTYIYARAGTSTLT